ncbi:chondroitin AC/alginate lyase [Plectosphaerella plurivora]|uniref:Chondroitin AC/alginate lyase n=1 Tax=Plectosphaerella plurivora TaxID=936078 RepID=A0A9P9AH68_9PEZI|nr:chondroitin AC/alginate lyase [Plectosphaerella plurivora]
MRSLSISLLLALASQASASPTPTTSGAIDSRQQPFVHPGLLHTSEDFDRIRGFVQTAKEPFVLDWVKLDSVADPDYVPDPHPTVWRERQTEGPTMFGTYSPTWAEPMFWLSAGSRCSTLKEIRGPSDRFLASGLQGYQVANAAEIHRECPAWKGFDATIDMLVNIFDSMNHEFTTLHLNQPDDHYWANWDLASLASMMVIGVVADRRDIWDEAIEYFKHGHGMGAIENAIWIFHTEIGTGKILGQGQEAGRDQGHVILDFALTGVIGQQACSQGVDLGGYLDNRNLAGAEYMAKYNLGHDVPFTTNINSVHGNYTVISAVARGQGKPIGELIYAHYASVKGLKAHWIGAYRDFVVEQGNGSEGGIGFYGSGSGRYDQVGFGTLLFRREE